MKITLSPFGGIYPRYADHFLGAMHATQAHDVKLRNGVLEPWMENCPFGEAVEGAKSFHLYGCCAVSWEDIVFTGDFPPDWNRFYITGRNGDTVLEAVELGCECAPTYYTGGVPKPTEAPQVSATEECSRDADARSYVYTYVNKWGEEGAPSEASNVVRVNDCTAVVVSNIVDPPDGYGIVNVNLYRATTGFRVADGKEQKLQTEYLYVTTLPVPLESSTFTDEICAVYLGSAIETEHNRMPPPLQGVLSVKDQIRLVGWYKNRVHMSQAFEPHNWPAKYDLTLDHTIVHMGELDQKLYVTTDSMPYIIDISNCNDMQCMPVTSVDTAIPDIGCKRANGAVMTPYGLFYASPIGIILLNSNGTYTVVTAKWFGEEEWRKLKPDTVTMAYYEGYLFFSTEMATFLLDVNPQVFANASNADLVTLSDKPVACELSNTGALVLLYDDGLWVWSGGVTPREYIWRSRPLTGGDAAVGTNAITVHSETKGGNTVGTVARGPLWTPTSIKMGGHGQATIETPHGTKAFDRYLATERPVRVSRVGRHLYYWLTLRSKATIEFLDIGTSNFTVAAGQ